MRFLIGSMALVVIAACGTEGTDTVAKPPDTSPTPSAVAFADVKPILDSKCVGCHGETEPKDGVRLNSYANVMAGGEKGPIVVAGKPEESEIVEVIGASHKPRMPFKMDPLSDAEIKKITDWVAQGAKE